MTRRNESRGTLINRLYLSFGGTVIAVCAILLNYDHHTGGSILEWKYDDSPLYAEMWSGEHMFALHQASVPDSLVVGGMRHYFGVRDVDAHYTQVKGNRIKASDIVDRPWMRMFTVTDPDGHILYFQTRPK